MSKIVEIVVCVKINVDSFVIILFSTAVAIVDLNLLQELTIIKLIALQTYRRWFLNLLVHASSLGDFFRHNCECFFESLDATVLVKRDNLDHVFWWRNQLENKLKLLITGHFLGHEQRLTNCIDSFKSIALQVESCPELDWGSRHLLLNICDKGLSLWLRDIKLTHHNVWLSQAKLESIVGVVEAKFVVEVPSKFLVEINKLDFELMGSQSQNEVHNF